ncbi:hypothetical protein [Advenella alkanexedens]|uniref:hypothetical protein n=1 Tax=Advenella alkanexedens TaxID=1481665 RepID=UPI0016B19EFA|nr:hypothetical protein [Advenella alkanexedens]NLY33554.1 hypothetical protein [Alcaligenaceae bacterium]WKU20486.1 hypothetical protein Q3V95_05595 [Advenella alkanexedens]
MSIQNVLQHLMQSAQGLISNQGNPPSKPASTSNGLSGLEESLKIHLENSALGRQQ